MKNNITYSTFSGACIWGYSNPSAASPDCHYGVQAQFPMLPLLDDTTANISAIDPSSSSGAQNMLCNCMYYTCMIH